MPTIKLTREQLYERVWSQPIHRLAPEFGLSDVGLAKLCRRHHVPIPGRGYWRRKETGHKVRQAPLPKPHEGLDTMVVIDRPAMKPAPAATADLHALVTFERQPENRIIVDDDIDANHPLIRATRQYWATRRRDQGEAAKLRRLAIDVSPASLPRALRIMQALLVACERRGYAVEAGTDGHSAVTVLGQAVRFTLEEATKQVLHERTRDEQEAAKRGVPVRRWDHVPNGRLALKVQRQWGVGRRVADGASQRVEERLNEFIERLVDQALVQQAERAEAERKERERQEAERLRKEAAARRREEVARIRGFEHVLAAFTRTRERRLCLSALREAAGNVEPASELGRWLQWVEGCVEQNDPARRLRERKPTITLHYAGGHDAEKCLTHGFKEQEHTPGYGREPEPPGILVSDYPWAVNPWDRDVTFDVPEEAVLPFECSEDGHWARRFRVPANVLNRYLRPRSEH